MFSIVSLIIIVIVFSLLLFLLAFMGQKNRRLKNWISSSPLVYILSLAVYCTTWTMFGSVGNVINSGYLFIAIYTGPTISAIFWWVIVRKLVRIKNEYRITSISDYLGTRYNSSGVAVVATIIALIVIAPYTALQIKAVYSIFTTLSGEHLHESGYQFNTVKLIILFILILFTLRFGARSLDPTKRHPGMMLIVAVESVIKLAAFLAVGLFVSYFMFDGVRDIFNRVVVEGVQVKIPDINSGSSTPVTLWITYNLLSFSAILFLPRQFHVTIIENSDERFIRKAQWLFPLYLFVINLFVVPIALAGVLKGFSPEYADEFVLLLPLIAQKPVLLIIVLLGGFSAATSMIMVSTMTLSTMITNHIVLPFGERFNIKKLFNKNILAIRWVLVITIILIGYFFEEILGKSNSLVSLGIVAFAGVLQFAPSMIGGLFWKKGNRFGAFWGMTSGFVIWVFTMIIPLLVKDGIISDSIMNQGLLGLSFLKPQQLLYIDIFDPITHSVFWSLLLNISVYIILSSIREIDHESMKIAESQVDILKEKALEKDRKLEEKNISLPEKVILLEKLLYRYYSEEKANNYLKKYLKKIGLTDQLVISIPELMRLQNEVRKNLAGIIGASEAYNVLKKEQLLSNDEIDLLHDEIKDVLIELNESPEELFRKLDYFKEKEKLLASHTVELEKQVEMQTQKLLKINQKLSKEVSEREKIEIEIKKERDRIKNYLDIAGVLIMTMDAEGRILRINRKGCEILSGNEKDIIGKFWTKSFSPPEEKENYEEMIHGLAENNLEKYEYSENEIITLKGEKKIIAWHNAILHDDSENQTKILSSGSDITLLKLSKDALKKSERKFKAIIANSNDAIYLLQNGRFTLVNRRFMEMFGVRAKEVYSKDFNLLDFVAPESKKEIQDRLNLRRQGMVSQSRYEFNAIGANGKKLVLDASTNVIHLNDGMAIQGILRDVTERQHLEIQLRSAQRLESIGQLAAGVAHEINTPIQFIGDNLNFIKEGIDDLIDLSKEYNELINQGEISVEKREELKHRVEEIDLDYIIEEIPNAIRETGEGVERVADIVRAMKDFTHPGKKEMNPTDLNKLIMDTSIVAKNEYKYNAELQMELDNNIPLIPCLASEMNQVLLNLMVNASQAIKEKQARLDSNDKGTITISTSRDEKHGIIRIADTGDGIPEEIGDRVFDPFFTTKDVGDGTGQGLAIAYNLIVEKHHGKISFQSEVNKGTTFEILLPLEQTSR